MKLRTRIGMAAIIAALGWAASHAPSAADEFDHKYYQSIANGPVEILSSWNCWFANCRPANCNLRTVQGPRLGRLRVEVRPAEMGGVCDGRPTRGFNIIYTPRRGARGIDEIILRSVADNGGRHILHLQVTVPGQW